ncbi:2-succinyl-5-enolpyruvyl-6-hydroxy-3-cyclohexene-1-carboxylic-acid synthase [Ktedonosporobacter rubrisoli]|uniref:2-succinyl-5-enolpyruvyl-6-hydroxy-3- cyclohexene-1-carboxylic-acid synthase n=1 Tax=Ktedonosporobacter rubrisoli TaxID=2509675 RepID=UPI003BF58532
MANPTYAYVGAFIDELQRAGIQHVVICPGSRSTPLALAMASQPALRIWMHIDERSAAFFGLGLAKQLHQPVALLCTSGTAAANFLPAVVEANLTHIPLLILTADRPHELRDCGAPQAIEQNRLYGSHTKWFMDVALPEASAAALRYIRTIANRATALTMAIPAGPVHLNLPFREPLTPDPLPDQPLPEVSQRSPLAWHGRPEHAPYVRVSDTPLGALAAEELTRLAALIGTKPRGLLVVGPCDNPALAEPLLQMAHTLHYPVLADPLSQLRGDPSAQSSVLTSYDAFLRIESFIAQAEPELIIRFGAMPTSKPLLLYMKRYAVCPQIVIDEHGGWNDPTQLASEFIHADPPTLCRALSNLLMDGAESSAEAKQAWLTSWQHTDQLTRQALLTSMHDLPALFEGRIFSELAELLPAESTLYVGNSMPVRDLDTFFWPDQRHIRCLGNRGANGIDGVVSSALGASAATRNKQASVLVIGDLSFLHDLNGLIAAHLHKLSLTIVLVNNDGGGIFSFLPQAAHPEHFEQLFGTPTGLDFRPAAQMYGGKFQRVKDWQGFREAINEGIDRGGLHIVEVPTERSSNVQMHRQLWQAVEKALQAASVANGR